MTATSKQDASIAQIEQAKAKQAAAEKAAQQMEKRLQTLAEQRQQLDAEEEQIRLDRLAKLKEAQQAEIEERRARLLAEPAPVTKAVAEEIAQQLLVAFEYEETLAAMDNRSEPLTPAQLWEFIDETRARLLTTQVDPGSQLLVLCVESILTQCDRWEHFRAGGVRVEVGSEGTGLGRDPRDNRCVKKLLRELHRIQQGKGPHQIESIGNLCATSVSFSQVAKILGLIDPSGNPDLPALGALIDRGRPTGPSWGCCRWLGCWDIPSAWTIRQQRVPIFRQKRADEVGGIALGSHRPGRLDGIGYVRQQREEIEAAELEQYKAAQQERAELSARGDRQGPQPVGNILA